jgi:signal peptidase I
MSNDNLDLKNLFADNPEMQMFLQEIDNQAARSANLPTLDAANADYCPPSLETLIEACFPCETSPETQEIFQKSPSPIRTVIKKVYDVAFWVVCSLLVLGSVLFVTSNDPGKSYFGFRTYSVLTGSMTPQADSLPGGFKAGDVIFIKMCKAQDVKVGDIITFNPSTREDGNTSFLTHRVVRMLSELGGKPGIYFVTKGDANSSEDPPISGEMVIGKKIFHIPSVGKILQSMRENFKSWIVTILCFFGFILMLRWYFSKPKNFQKTKKQFSAA